MPGLIPIIPLSTMTTPELLAAYNSLAKDRGVEKLKKWSGTRCQLGERVAILRTMKRLPEKIAPKKSHRTKIAGLGKPRPQAIRSATLAALCIVTHYEDSKGNRVGKKTPRALAVGLPYSAVLKIVRKQFPKSKVCTDSLWWAANKASSKTPGFECNLPHKRPRSK